MHLVIPVTSFVYGEPKIVNKTTKKVYILFYNKYMVVTRDKVKVILSSEKVRQCDLSIE